MLMVAAVSLASSFFNSLVVRILIKPRVLREKTERLKAFRAELAAAKRLGDRKLLKKLDKQQIYISQLEKEVNSSQFKMAVISMTSNLLPFLLLSYSINMSDVAGFLPAPLLYGSDKTPLSLYIWYFICILFSTLVFKKTLGT
ncbi:MAG: EMC3/TMCO1 family protein [Thermoproteota archaeon]